LITNEEEMKAIELSGQEGFESLRVIEVEKPKPGASEVLIEVKAAAINFGEIELTRGKYPRRDSYSQGDLYCGQENASCYARKCFQI
jgi:NADPH:quinone reductase-like Zn-dependent oxidoreductase